MKLLIFFCVLSIVSCQTTEEPSCGRNEVYDRCGTACPPTCDEPKPTICTMNCIIGCRCADGFVRHEGKCIFPAYCPRVCKENEELLQCGTACEPSCENPDPTVCTMQCLINVCQCKNGFVRNSEGNCVDRSTCSATTPKPNSEEESD